jgi:hypothetical protein
LPVKRVPPPRGRLFGTVPDRPLEPSIGSDISTQERWNPIRLPASLDRGPAAKAWFLPILVERWCHLGLIQNERNRVASRVAAPLPADSCCDVVAGRGRVRPRKWCLVASRLLRAQELHHEVVSIGRILAARLSQLSAVSRPMRATACFQLPNKWLDSITILRRCLLGSRKTC